LKELKQIYQAFAEVNTR